MNLERVVEIFLLGVLPTIMFTALIIGIRIDYCKRKRIKVKKFNYSIGKSVSSRIGSNNHTEADMEYLQGRELSG